MATLNIGHRSGGRVVSITAVAHAVNNGSHAAAHFVGTVEREDGTRHTGDIMAFNLCAPQDGDRTDLDRATAALSEYMRINGEFDDDGWVPHRGSGSAGVSL